MSSVGFVPDPKNEVEQLRNAYSSLNDIARNLAGALRCLQQRDLKTATAHLNTAQWHTEQAKKSSAAVGLTKAKKSS